LSRALIPAGGTWNRAGVILHPRSPGTGLFRTSADDGAEPVAQTTLAPGETGHVAPCFLPDDRHFLFFATGSPSVRGIYLGDLAGTTPRRIADADAAAVFGPPDQMLYVRQGTLFAQTLDMRRLTLVGDPVLVAQGVDADRDSAIAALSASAPGLFAYRTGGAGKERQFVWFDRSGRVLALIGSAESRGAAYASASPDYRRVAFQKAVDGNVDIWLLDLERNASIRITSEPQPEIAPVFSPTGDRIVFSAVRGGTFDLYGKGLGAGPGELVWRSDQPKQATDWSRDGRFLLVRSLDPELDWDVWAVPSGGGEPIPLARTKFEEREAQFAPDGRWIAYQSNESGRFEIYAQPFQRAGERVRVSTSGDGGVEPRWRSDGRELFYISLDGQLTAVPVTLTKEGGGLRPGAPARLFRAPVGPLQDLSLHHYIVSPDGRRFLMDTIVAAPAPPIVVVQNWKPGTPAAAPPPDH
jgi:WD40-like Beta Propeller Repeat